MNNPIPSNLKSEAKKAAKILRDFTQISARNGPDKLIPAHVIAKAEGLAIISVIKAGFLITARGGSGIVIARLADRRVRVRARAVLFPLSPCRRVPAARGPVLNNPIPSNLKSEAKKAAKILRDFTQISARNGPDKLIPGWSAPSAIGIAGLGGGFEIGVEVFDLVVICSPSLQVFDLVVICSPSLQVFDLVVICSPSLQVFDLVVICSPPSMCLT
ncbi:hypothetical protein CRUP_022222 [Coryphaenoides rupestris]|nr:hypothetical protein CRUP_022222 [Coryphaenoides rupestris]